MENKHYVYDEQTEEVILRQDGLNETIADFRKRLLEQEEHLIEFTNDDTLNKERIELVKHGDISDVLDLYGYNIFSEDELEMFLEEKLNGMALYELADVARDELGYDADFYENDEEFFNMMYHDNLGEMARAIYFGNYRYHDEYIRLDAYGNIQTLDEDDLRDELVYDHLEEYIRYKKDGN